MISSDIPIDHPRDDEFGVDGFARAIGKAIEKLPAPEGTVLALTGPWGSGKSSAINLIVHHLKKLEDNGSLKIIVFNPWWYTNDQVIAKAFFQHLYAGLGKNLSNKARKLILSLGRNLLGSGPLISTVADVLTFGIAGKLIEGLSSSAAEAIKTDRTVEDDYKKLFELLRKQNKRFLVVIDDIDRLTPDQTIIIFRLVKSVGRLPNLIYLLAFDRELAEEILAERFPAERHFLEKIVQAAFEIPLPEPTLLHDGLLRTLVEIAGHPKDEEGVRFRNILADIVQPLITLPRDLVRFVAAISVSWAAIGEEIDLADLVAIEALRLFRFPLHQVIRSHRNILCGTGEGFGRPRNQEKMYSELFLASAKTDGDRDYIRTALRRLFPRLDSVWSNMHYNRASEREWHAKRRICAPAHFSSYFRLALGADVIPRRLLDEVIARAGDGEYVQKFFRERGKATRTDGRSEIPIVLDDLIGFAYKIPSEKIIPFLSAIFEIADELDLERDEERGFGSLGTNQLRLHWLINELVRERLPQADRSRALEETLKAASLGWAVDLTRRIYSEYHPRTQERSTPPNQCLVDTATASQLVVGVLERLRKAAETGELLQLRHLIHILFRWREFAGDDEEVKRWTNVHLSQNSFLISLAAATTSTSWVSSGGFAGMGDRVSRGVPFVRLDVLEPILDVDRFLARVAEVEASPLKNEDKSILGRFREGMRRQQEEDGRRSGTNEASADRTDDDESHEESEIFADATAEAEDDDRS
jgi:predicted KAP-like P-loop ATPase